MRLLAMSLAIFSVFVAACATYPQSREDQATYHTNEARQALSKGDNLTAAYQMEAALTRPTGDTKVKDLLAAFPNGREIYIAYLSKLIAEINNAYVAEFVLEKLAIAKSAGILSSDQIQALQMRFENAIANGNKTGAIPFDLADNLESFPVLRTPEHHRVIVDRSIKKLQSGSERKPLNGVLKHVRQVGVASHSNLTRGFHLKVTHGLCA